MFALPYYALNPMNGRHLPVVVATTEQETEYFHDIDVDAQLVMVLKSTMIDDGRDYGMFTLITVCPRLDALFDHLTEFTAIVGSTSATRAFERS